MAVLGAQFVFSMLMFCFLQKLSCYYSFGQWLIGGRLVQYLYPSDDELKKLAGIPTNSGKSKGRRNDLKKILSNKNQPFNVPRNIPLQLETAKVEPIQLAMLNYYADYQWLLDYSFATVVIYVLTEIYYTFFSRQPEFNVSIVWCLIAVAFCLRILVSQAIMYFKTDEGGERTLCIMFGFFFLVAAMGVLVVDDDILEFGLEDGYTNFSVNAEKYLMQQGLGSYGPMSLLSFKIMLAFTCAIIGSLVTFPGLRLSKMHVDALKYSKEQPLFNVLIHVNFVLPIAILLLWVKPIGRDLFCGLSQNISWKMMTEEQFETTRLLLVVVMVILRLCLLTTHLQSYLNIAFVKVEEMKKESGKITSLELQKMVARVFYYLGVVATQYVTPVIMMLFLTFLLKTLGDYSWCSYFGVSFAREVTDNIDQVRQTLENNTTAESIVDKAAEFSWVMSNLRSIFTSAYYRGLLSFLLWWLCGCWYTCTIFGVTYYSKVMAA